MATAIIVHSHAITNSPFFTPTEVTVIKPLIWFGCKKLIITVSPLSIVRLFSHWLKNGHRAVKNRTPTCRIVNIKKCRCKKQYYHHQVWLFNEFFTGLYDPRHKKQPPNKAKVNWSPKWYLVLAMCQLLRALLFTCPARLYDAPPSHVLSVYGQAFLYGGKSLQIRP